MANETQHILRKRTGEQSSADEVAVYFAAVPRGAEEITAQELAVLGINTGKSARGGVSFTTNREGMYRVNLWLRTASRVLKQLAQFPCSSPEELYTGVRQLPWYDIITPTMTLAVDCSLRDSVLTHSGFVALKTKDAIVDSIRDRCGSRPNVDTESPDVRVNIHLVQNVCTVSLDSSGAPLDRRGYRLERNEAPLRETLAAAMLLSTGWDGSKPLVDPMCGSGTIPIEAALIGCRIPPGLHRSFGFQRWQDYDRRLWERIVKEAEQGIQPLAEHTIIGSDRDGGALGIARRNAAKAGVEQHISFVHQTLEEFQPPAEPGTLLVNPPYGKRLGDEDELKELYHRIGDIMKQRCRGWTGYVLAGNLELAKHIGLKASRRQVLFNGPLECRLMKYELY